ncbi:MAG: hypothetical protein JW918_01535 [Anaerolineae bacterium]|nr:hypothetical protein [Anaerolineae bacterium]
MRHLKTGLIVSCAVAGVISLLIVARLAYEFAELIMVNSQYPSVSEYYEMACSRVKIGDRREDAVQALSDAWYHGECDYLSGLEPHFIDDVFFYGPPNRPEYARMVIVLSKSVDGTLIVTDIGTAESYRLLEYEACIPPEFVQ